MAWFAFNGTASRFGATRTRLEQSGSSAAAYCGYWGYSTAPTIRGTLYTVTSAGALTQQAQSALVTIQNGKTNIPVTIPTQVSVPTDGGVALKIAIMYGGYYGESEAASVTFFTPPQTDAVIQAGTHNLNVETITAYDYDEDLFLGEFVYGSNLTYAPDSICFSGTPPATTTIDALFFGAGL